MVGPSQPTLKRLFAVSGNRCAFPKCQTAIVTEGVVIGEVCHIKAAKPNGPRYDASQAPEQRHGFENLILMCGTHHTVIDDDEDAYSVERLMAMKLNHEANSHLIPDEAAAAAAISINQSGGITAHSLSVQNLNLYGPGAQPAISGAESPDANAIALLAPELARVLTHQIRALDRATANFICASTSHPLPTDHWTAFQPLKPTLYPAAHQVRDLAAADSSLLAEFYSALDTIEDLIGALRVTGEIWDTNAWNVLMQRIEHAVSIGVKAADQFCPGRQYDPTVPAAGTIAERAAAASTSMRRSLSAHIERQTQKLKR